jgi:hypothetical protein
VTQARLLGKILPLPIWLLSDITNNNHTKPNTLKTKIFTYFSMVEVEKIGK